MRRPHPRRLPPVALRAAVIAATSALTAPQTARANLNFNLSTGGATLDPRALAGFQQAAARWSANFSDNININLTIGFSPLPSGVIGETSTVYYHSGAAQSINYSTYANALAAHRTSADDNAAVASLGSSSTFAVYLNHTSDDPNGSNSPTPYLDNNASPNNTQVGITQANARAVGLVRSNSTATDASITFSSTFSFDFDPSDGIASGDLDFVGVATHEIGHALGFVSTADDIDSGPGQSADNYFADALDLFRFSSDSAAQGARDIAADTRNKYFSLDNGATSIAPFSTGDTFGDGNQASHWKDNLGIGIMDPTAGFGETLAVSNTDRRLFDVLGYTRNFTWAWTDTSSSPATAYWSNASQWNADGVPDPSVTAVFNNNAASPYTVTVKTPATPAALVVAKDKVILALTTNGSLTTNSITLAQSPGDNAALTLTRPAGAGAFTTSSLNVAAAPNTTASLSVQAPLTVTGNTTVGSAGAVTIAAGVPFSTASLTNSGAFTTPNPLITTGPISANAGALTAASISAPSLSLTGPAKVVVSPSTTPTATKLAALTFSTTNTTFSDGRPNLLPTSTLDLNNSDLILDYAGSPSPLDTLRQLITVAARGAAGADPHVLWSGPGITSSAARALATHQSPGPLTALAYEESAQYINTTGTTLFDNQTLDLTSVLVKYTFVGDANLDGLVNDADVNILIAHFNDHSNSNLWTDADFNYDGVVDNRDLDLLSATYNPAQNSPTFDITPAAYARLAALLTTPIPEPNLALAAPALACLLTTRRRPRRANRGPSSFPPPATV